MSLDLNGNLILNRLLDHNLYTDDVSETLHVNGVCLQAVSCSRSVLIQNSILIKGF